MQVRDQAMHPKYKLTGIRKSPSHVSTKWRGVNNCNFFLLGRI